jgi:hypothetical protein
MDQVLEDVFAEGPRSPVTVAGFPMLRVQTQAHDVLVWTGPRFVMTFGRAQERDHAWLEELAGATERAVREHN